MSDPTTWPPPAVENDPTVLAHFGWRTVGFLADVANLLAVFAVLVVAHTVVIATWASDAVSGVTVAAVAGFVVWLRIKWEGSGGSPLRRRLGILIVDADTLEPIGTRRGLVRALVRLASELVFYIGYLWMIWDPMRQTWHDKAARSIVVKR